MTAISPPQLLTMSSLARSMTMGMAEDRLVKAALIGLSEKGETAEDLMAFAMPFMEASVKVRTKHVAVLDMCGTGGASFRTFNVSTLASIVVSSLGVPVAKHGNRSSNGRCGSADLMEALGYDLGTDAAKAEAMLDEVGFAFLFAPNFHPAMRHVAPVRKEIGRRTIFNLLGPLLNPVTARRRQLMGVNDPRLLDIVADALSATGVERAMVVHGDPGMDEVSTLGTTTMVEVGPEGKTNYQIHPNDFGIPVPNGEDVREMCPAEAARTARSILSHEDPSRSGMVALNAACGLKVFGRARTLEEGYYMSVRAMRDGRASSQLETLLSYGRNGP